MLRSLLMESNSHTGLLNLHGLLDLEIRQYCPPQKNEDTINLGAQEAGTTLSFLMETKLQITLLKISVNNLWKRYLVDYITRTGYQMLLSIVYVIQTKKKAQFIYFSKHIKSCFETIIEIFCPKYDNQTGTKVSQLRKTYR